MHVAPFISSHILGNPSPCPLLETEKGVASSLSSRLGSRPGITASPALFKKQRRKKKHTGGSLESYARFLKAVVAKPHISSHGFLWAQMSGVKGGPIKSSGNRSEQAFPWLLDALPVRYLSVLGVKRGALEQKKNTDRLPSSTTAAI